MARVTQQFVCQDRGEMLQRHGRGEAGDRRLGPDEIEPPVDPILERLQIVARLVRALVEGDMLAAVHHLLGRERLDLGSKLGRSVVPELTHALDEKGLALREGCGERVVERRRDRIPAIPPAFSPRAATEPAVPRRDHEIGGCDFARHICISLIMSSDGYLHLCQ